MRRRKQPLPDPEYLVASIENIEETYYVSQERERGRYLDDEAIIEVIGKIEKISPRHKRFIGNRIEMSFVCSRRFGSDHAQSESGPALFSMNLRKGGCSFMAYLPADAFWALPAIITSKAITCVETTFAHTRYRSGELLSVYFATPAKLEQLAAVVARYAQSPASAAISSTN